MAQNVGPTRFADTPLKNLPGWIGQNLTSVTGIKRTLGVSFLNFQYNQRYKFPGPVAPLFVACATLGAMLQHEFHEAVEGAWPEPHYAQNKGHGDHGHH